MGRLTRCPGTVEHLLAIENGLCLAYICLEHPKYCRYVIHVFKHQKLIARFDPPNCSFWTVTHDKLLLVSHDTVYATSLHCLGTTPSWDEIPLFSSVDILSQDARRLLLGCETDRRTYGAIPELNAIFISQSRTLNLYDASNGGLIWAMSRKGSDGVLFRQHGSPFLARYCDRYLIVAELRRAVLDYQEICLSTAASISALQIDSQADKFIIGTDRGEILKGPMDEVGTLLGNRRVRTTIIPCKGKGPFLAMFAADRCLFGIDSAASATLIARVNNDDFLEECLLRDQIVLISGDGMLTLIDGEEVKTRRMKTFPCGSSLIGDSDAILLTTNNFGSSLSGRLLSDVMEGRDDELWTMPSQAGGDLILGHEGFISASTYVRVADGGRKIETASLPFITPELRVFAIHNDFVLAFRVHQRTILEINLHTSHVQREVRVPGEIGNAYFDAETERIYVRCYGTTGLWIVDHFDASSLHQIAVGVAIVYVVRCGAGILIAKEESGQVVCLLEDGETDIVLISVVSAGDGRCRYLESRGASVQSQLLEGSEEAMKQMTSLRNRHFMAANEA